jgi:hypothetical protein
MKKQLKTFLTGCMLVGLLSAFSPAEAKPLLVEAESFHEKGGWVIDQQFMDVMGSPFLMAHGLGRPVAPARTSVVLPAIGSYEVFVRTRDWVSPYGPGQFAVDVDGQRLPITFGVKTSGEWGWQSGGTVTVTNATVQLVLTDLTGFDGRCDALLFVPSQEVASVVLPTSTDFAWRRELLGLPADPPLVGTYDLVVVGGGYAGICAAVSAARLGLQVALIQDRPVLGGNASSEVRVGPIGGLSLPPFERNADLLYEIYKVSWTGDAVGGLRPAPKDSALEKWVRAQAGLSLFLGQHVCRVTKEGTRIVAVTTQDVETSQERRFRGRLFADCTGDGSVGFLAGADFRCGAESPSETEEALASEEHAGNYLGASNLWTTRWTKQPTGFPVCPWALPITEASLNCTSFDSSVPVRGDVPYFVGWNWECGFRQDQIRDAEAIRDHNFRAAYGTWDFLKNRSPHRAFYANAELSWMAYVLGKRESRRLLGDYILTEQDLTQHRLYDDGCVTTTWYLDLHYPHPNNSKYFPGQEFRSIAYDDPHFTNFAAAVHGTYKPVLPYPIPYRCFYSRNVENLFMAGRNVSVTHVALASVRVMNTTALMGAVVGRAAFVCTKNGCSPREVYTQHLDELKALLKNPDARTPLSVAGEKQMEGRDTLWKEVKYWIRKCLHPVKVFLLSCVEWLKNK